MTDTPPDDSSIQWSLHPQLEQDAEVVGALALSWLLLSNDGNYPWLLLVPMRPGAREITHLDEADQRQLMAEIAAVSGALKAITGCDKLNVAAIGNMVPQLHVHIVARRHDDPAWPKPVWGAVPARAREAVERERLIAALRSKIRLGIEARPATTGAADPAKSDLSRKFRTNSEMRRDIALSLSSCELRPTRRSTNVMPVRLDLGAKPYLGFTGNVLDRAADLRPDPSAISNVAADPAARFLVIAGELVCLKKGEPFNDPRFKISEAAVLAGGPRGMHEQVFLGTDGSGPLFAVAIDREAAEALKGRDDLLITDLRSAAMRGLVTQEHLPSFAQAKSLLGWHDRHRFCPTCGSRTDVVQAGWRRDCPACQAQHFPRTDPVVIMLAVHGDQCLLGRQPRFGKGMWSCLAGFVEPGETIEEAVRRETLEEAGIVCGRVAYFASQPWPFPMSLMIGCHAEALTTEITVDRTELEDCRWFPRDEVADMLLRRHPDGLTATHPFAIAYHIIREWLEAGRNLF